MRLPPLSANSFNLNSWKKNTEGSALVFLSFCEDPATMILNNPFGYGQAHPCSFDTCFVVEPLENRKDLRDVFLVEANAIVGDLNTYVVLILIEPKRFILCSGNCFRNHFNQRLAAVKF